MKKLIGFVSILALVMVFAAAAPAAEVEGFLVDKMCSAKVGKGGQKAAAMHTKDCALMPPCEASGYGVFTADSKFITFDEIISGKEQIVPLERLSADDLKRLVIERHRVGPDFRVQVMSGPSMSRDEVIEAIRRDEPFGIATIEAESSHLRDLLKQIEEALGEEE